MTTPHSTMNQFIKDHCQYDHRVVHPFVYVHDLRKFMEGKEIAPSRTERLADHLKHIRGLPPYSAESDLYQDEYFIVTLENNYTPEEFLHAEVLLLPAEKP